MAGGIVKTDPNFVQLPGSDDKLDPSERFMLISVASLLLCEILRRFFADSCRVSHAADDNSPRILKNPREMAFKRNYCRFLDEFT